MFSGSDYESDIVALPGATILTLPSLATRSQCHGNQFSCSSAEAAIARERAFIAKEAKRLLAHFDTEIDESIQLKQQLMDEIAQCGRTGVAGRPRAPFLPMHREAC